VIIRAASFKSPPRFCGIFMTSSASGEPTPPLLSATPAAHGSTHQSFWLWVLCLTGVDYFSTLAYQPSIAITSAGRLAPIATILLILVTLFGAVPIYCRVAKSSPHGQGSIAMLQRLVRGCDAADHR